MRTALGLVGAVILGVVVGVASAPHHTRTLTRTGPTVYDVPQPEVIDVICPNGVHRTLMISPTSPNRGHLDCSSKHHHH